MQIEKAKESGALPTIEKCKVYKSRWLMLGMFVIFSASNSMQWIEYSIIADVIANYYNVSTTAVDWLSMIYMALYIPFIFPASYILDKMVSSILNYFTYTVHQLLLCSAFETGIVYNFQL